MGLVWLDIPCSVKVASFVLQTYHKTQHNYHTDKTYIHQLERDHLDYVASQLEFLSQLKLVSINNDEQEQEASNDAPQPQ